VSDETVSVGEGTENAVVEERISVQELVNRCVEAVNNPDTSRKNKLLVSNVIRALMELVTRLGEAEDELETLRKPKSNLVFMPTKES
jgi:hypothetical protein